ncbi:MAG: hypothetical protein ACJ8F3_14290 [Xanthobacteraceae bacterium]
MLNSPKIILTVAGALTIAALSSAPAEAGSHFGFFSHGPFVSRPIFVQRAPVVYPESRPVAHHEPKRPQRVIAVARPVPVVVRTPVIAPKPVTPVSPTCLTKQYLDTGAVRFEDTCTHEWAVNSTTVEKKSAAGASCLSKQEETSMIMFKDTCTGEWAMNTLATADLK